MKGYKKRDQRIDREIQSLLKRDRTYEDILGHIPCNVLNRFMRTDITSVSIRLEALKTRFTNDELIDIADIMINVKNNSILSKKSLKILVKIIRLIGIDEFDKKMEEQGHFESCQDKKELIDEYYEIIKKEEK
jgi:hypothetical protein